RYPSRGLAPTVRCRSCCPSLAAPPVNRAQPVDPVNKKERAMDTTIQEASSGVSSITERERQQIERANATNATPVVFIHGLWLLPSSWDPWAGLFEEAGYV